MKSRDTELADQFNYSLALLFSRDVYRFWSPLDCRFAEAMGKYAHFRDAEYMNLFWSGYMRAYLPYDETTRDLSTLELNAAWSQAAVDAYLSGSYTDTGRCYETVILGQPDTAPPDQLNAPNALLLKDGTVYLEWSKGVDDVGVAGYNIYRNEQKIATTIWNAYLDESLTAAGSYSYRIEVFDAFANLSVLSPEALIVTDDTTPPSAPTDLTGTAMSATEVSLSWTTATDDVGVAQYMIFRGESTSALAKIASTPDPAFIDSTLPYSGKFYYAVSAVDASGNYSELSNLISVVTNADTTPPSTPADLAVQPISISELQLTWSGSSDDTAVAGYRVYVGPSPDQLALAASVTNPSYTQGGLEPSSTLYFSVDAFDAAGNSSGLSAAVSGTTLADLEAPSLPSDLSAAGVSNSRIDLAWTASTDNHRIDGYRIFRSEDGITFVLADFTSGTSWSNTGLAAGTTYHYRLEALDAAGNSSGLTATVSATTTAKTKGGPRWRR